MVRVCCSSACSPNISSAAACEKVRGGPMYATRGLDIWLRSVLGLDHRADDRSCVNARVVAPTCDVGYALDDGGPRVRLALQHAHRRHDPLERHALADRAGQAAVEHTG